MLRTFKAIIRLLATYAGPAWHQLMSETQKTKLERQYVGGLKACCGLSKDTAERGAETVERATCNRGPEDTRPPHEKPKPQETKEEIVEDEWRRMRGDTKAEQKKKNHTSFVKSYLSNHCTHPILGEQPPPLSEEESILPRNTRMELARLRAERSLLLEKYKAKVENRPVESCIKCSDDEGDLKNFLKCYSCRNYGRTPWPQPQPLAWLLRHSIWEETPIRDRRLIWKRSVAQQQQQQHALNLQKMYSVSNKTFKVDKAAIKFILNGSTIMCPGLTSPGAKLTSLVPKDTVVAVTAEGKQNALAIGLMSMSSGEIQSVNKGNGIENLHYLNDGLWHLAEKSLN
uniref:PUA domain-containing protein n=1 Tax=Caenorhabditis japonica TaxID=281687 RepID=A0A8R1DYV7_CAEJA